MSAILLSLTAVVSTLAGGLFALRFFRQMHLILSFSGGVLLGVVSFVILPEIFDLARENAVNATAAMAALVFGFLLFHSLEKFILSHRRRHGSHAAHHHPQMGLLAALLLASHSFMDGVAIGLSFQVSETVGVAVLMAVIAHDFCDGINTVSLMLVHRNSAPRALAMLVFAALAPVAGAASTLMFQVSPFVLMLYLGFFAGFLLHICASDILPEAHAQAGAAATVPRIALTCLGAAFIFVAVQLGG